MSSWPPPPPPPPKSSQGHYSHSPNVPTQQGRPQQQPRTMSPPFASIQNGHSLNADVTRQTNQIAYSGNPSFPHHDSVAHHPAASYEPSHMMHAGVNAHPPSAIPPPSRPHPPHLPVPPPRPGPPPYQTPYQTPKQPHAGWRGGPPPPPPPHQRIPGPPVPYGLSENRPPQPAVVGTRHLAPPPGPISRYGPPPPPYNNSSASAGMSLPPPPTQHPRSTGHALPPPPSQSSHQPPTKTKIDPSQIPRTPLFTRPNDVRPIPIHYPRATLTAGAQDAVQPPPPADSRFLVEDDGNASPQLIRSTVYSMPLDRAAWRKCGEVDLGLLCNPMALPSNDFVLRPRVTLDSQTDDVFEEDWHDAQAIPMERTIQPDKPPRCSRCKAYISPFWDVDQERCNMCGSRTPMSTLQIAGNSLPFRCGTVDYVVGGPYVTRTTPVKPVVIFAVDLTCPSVTHYIDVLEDAVNQLAYHYERQGQRSRKRAESASVGIVFVGVSGIYVPDPRGGFVVVPDVQEEPFCPFPLTEWTWNVASARGRQSFDMFIKEVREEGNLKKLVSKNRETNALSIGALASPRGAGDSNTRRGHSLSCGGAALAFLVDALRHTGGRGIWISWRRPNYGLGTIRDRERSKDPYGKGESFLYKPLQRHPAERLKENLQDAASARFYTELGKECAKSCIALDVVLHTDPTVPQSFLDLATMGELCRVSCGRIVWIPHKLHWRQTMLEELLRHQLCFSGWDAVFKVRCSEGLQVKRFDPNSLGVVHDGGLTDSPDLELAVVTPDTRISVELEHRVGGLRKDTKFVYLQTALLYTCIASGERRVRVSTLALRVAGVAADTFRSMDFGTIAAFQLRHAAESMLQQPQDASEVGEQTRRTSQSALLERCQKMLASYRMHTKAYNSPSGQLILPEKLQLLPLFCTSLIKSPLLRPSLPKRGSGIRSAVPSPRADDRSFYLWQAATSSSPANTMLMVHPNLFTVEKSNDGTGSWCQPERPQRLGDAYISEQALSRFVQLPQTLHPTIYSLSDDGIFLLDACFVIYLYFGRRVPTDIAEALQTSLSKGAPAAAAGIDRGRVLTRLIWQLRAFSHVGGGSESMMRPTFAPVVVVKDSGNQDDEWSRDVNRWMVCDATPYEKDYVDFLCDIHRQIKTRVDAGKA